MTVAQAHRAHARDEVEVGAAVGVLHFHAAPAHELDGLARVRAHDVFGFEQPFLVEAHVFLLSVRKSCRSAPCRTLAEQMGALGGGGLTRADVYDAVSAALASADISSPAVYIDGREMTNALAPRMGARLGQIERRRSSGL